MTRRSTVSRLAFHVPAITGAIAYFFLPPIPQPESYHHFADQRTLLGVPHFFDVLSNLPFAVVGILGLRAFKDMVSRVLFGGIFLVAIGSGYYHLQPDTARLEWDRAPMTIAFMAILALLLQEFWSERTGRLMLFPLVAAGLFSIWWWKVSGDLRFYGLVQFVPMLMIAAALLVFRSPRDKDLWSVFLFYGLAKIAETFDARIFSVLPFSGHTIKHLLAGLATYWIYRWRMRSIEENERLSGLVIETA